MNIKRKKNNNKIIIIQNNNQEIYKRNKLRIIKIK